DWIGDNTFRDPAVKGCGLGDIRWMLESQSFGGKCADRNALFVGLCRSVGLPARDLYGLRLCASRPFKILVRNGDVTGSQYCRAEPTLPELAGSQCGVRSPKRGLSDSRTLGLPNSRTPLPGPAACGRRPRAELLTQGGHLAEVMRVVQG